MEHYGAGEALLPLLEALSQGCRGPEGERLMGGLRRYAPTWLLQLPWLVSPEEREILQREVLGATQQRLLRELCELLEALSAERPLVLVLEDLHWSDHATLDLLSVLARRRERASLLVLGTYRPLEVIVREHPLRAVKRDLQVHELSAQLPLELLTQGQVADYLALRFPDSELVEGLAEWIYRRTEGHPLFMANLVEYLIAQGRLVQAEGRWALRGDLDAREQRVPENLKQMIEQQIAQLRPEHQRLLEVASLAGAEFSAALLAHALGVDLLATENACAELARRGQLLRPGGVAEWPDGTVAGCYGFLHALYPEVLSQRLPPAQRVYLHHSLGERLEAAYGLRAGAIAAELALHFEAGRDPLRAVKYLRQAAETAARRYAHREAIDYLTRALDLLGRLPAAECAAVRMRLLEQRGLVRRAMDDMSGAVADFDTFLTCAEELGQAEAEVQAMIHLNFALFWLDRERSLEIARQALERSGALQDKVQRAHAKANYAGWTLMLRGWQDAEFQRFNDAGEVISRFGDAHLRCEYAVIHGYLQFHRSRYLECYQTARQGMRLALDIGDPFHHISCQTFATWALLHRGEWGEMQRLASEGLKSSDANGLLFGSKFFRLNLAQLHLQAFAYEPARRLAEAGLEQARQTPYDNFATFYGLLLLGMAHLGLGQPARTRDYLEEIKLRAKAKPLVLDWLLQMPLCQLQGDYWQAVGNREQARETAHRLCALAGPPGERAYLAEGYRLLAEIALAEQHWEAAEANMAQALAVVLSRAEVPLAAWRVYATAAELNDRQGRTAEATACWNRSAAVIHALADSLEQADPLRQSLLTALPVQAILGRSTSSG